MRRTFADLTSITEGKYFLIAGGFCAILLILMLLTGQITFMEILEMERKEIELCPFRI